MGDPSGPSQNTLWWLFVSDVDEGETVSQKAEKRCRWNYSSLLFLLRAKIMKVSSIIYHYTFNIWLYIMLITLHDNKLMTIAKSVKLSIVMPGWLMGEIDPDHHIHTYKCSHSGPQDIHCYIKALMYALNAEDFIIAFRKKILTP